ncbi:peptidoglycan DD-metalloendopeptidase family protein [Actinomyces vulturis]|uniref:peptidoglycan DD-metalloendopeptidase family protein n=1 Tax=Actinomyces vulturis TaxID=1857645 RepID=UPI00083397F6|nr:peptidoglycan DD-metalloendopeptidase family protein [Actinomyces vulturis]
MDKKDGAKETKDQATSVASSAVQGASKGGQVGAVLTLATNKDTYKLAWKVKKTQWKIQATLIAVVISMLCAPLFLFSSNDSSTVDTDARTRAIQGDNVTGFKGAGELSGLGERAKEVAAIANDYAIPPALLMALVAPDTGPWRADTDEQLEENAINVAKALRDAKDHISSPYGWDMLTGTVICEDNILVIGGGKCPSGITTDPSLGLGAKEVQEAWVSALVSADGLPSPRKGSGRGASKAPIPPPDLKGSVIEKVKKVAAAYYGISDENITQNGKWITVSTDKNLSLATSIVGRAKDFQVSHIEVRGQSWSPDEGWIDLEPEDTSVDDPQAENHLRIKVCDDKKWGQKCEEKVETEHMDTKTADAIYALALQWTLGTDAGLCKSSSGPAPAPASTAATAGTNATPSASSSAPPSATVSEVESTSGEKIVIDESIQNNISNIVKAGHDAGMSEDEILVALMTASVETRMRNLANDGSFTYIYGSGVMSESEWVKAKAIAVKSMDYPHDGVGSDWDSVGIFQQRNSWGSVEDRMDVYKSAGFFFERLKSVHADNPSLSLGELAQKVQVSAYPDRYAAWENAARQMMGLAGPVSGGCKSVASGQGWTYPLESFYVISDPWNPSRMNPALHYPRPHWGTDIAAPAGAIQVAVNDGKVIFADCYSGNGMCMLAIDTVDGWRIRYKHILTGSFQVKVGDEVKKGQPVASTGATGDVTGPHLHIEASEISVIGDTLDCDPDDPSMIAACPNPEDTFNAHGVDLATGEVRTIGGGGSSEILEFARSMIGGPYVWGGSGPRREDGYDCSGLVQAAYASVGIELPHQAWKQCEMGSPVPLDQAQAGDIICWATPGSPRAHHVAISDGAGGYVGAQSEAEGIKSGPMYGVGSEDVWARRIVK